MKAFLFVINIIAFVGVLLWFIFEPSWESGSSCGVAFVALISQFFWNESVNKIINKNKTVFGANKTNYINNSIETNSSNKVKQAKNTVTNGDIAGRDINK